MSAVHETDAQHHCQHGYHNHHDDYHFFAEKKLTEEFEEENLKLFEFVSDHDHYQGVWIDAMGCSLLVNLASLICLIFLPSMFIQGKPSKTVVNSLAVFGAGAMLGDAFFHQLPHAFVGIVLFLLVEKVVRYVEDVSGGVDAWSHGHHHYHHRKSEISTNKTNGHDNSLGPSLNDKDRNISKISSEEKVLQRASDETLNVEKQSESALLWKRH